MGNAACHEKGTDSASVNRSPLQMLGCYVRYFTMRTR